ncbi:glutathione S-transferase C-terminal domain-containing protein [Streptomyces sp. GMY02]|uniref:glutathione S-transferase C-terminal domain-containing protein n=1 Tax=Streptomyces sp. GMY02 TaxID=1333528 RepID=UPI001C2B8BBB|nr:glutathione S-transferase C-terminal domain-containing protein [Streptomyces sp. GMY02]QXE33782.1 glutathione S-transferase C-terminal domain-containing protein [Streptomyces sp. GMY02]
MSETVAMSETLSAVSEPLAQTSFPASLRDAHPGTAPRFRDRIGADLGGGYYPVAHRYHLYLSLGCPGSMRISITLGLLGLKKSVRTTLLPSPPGACDALAALRTAYETTRHRYDGPPTVPALCDLWSGRVVNNHTPDILDDLALRFTDQDNADLPRLRPAALAADIDAIRRLLGEGPAPDPALDFLERQLASHPYALGETLTAADVDLWVALVHLDTDALRRVAAGDRLWSYVRRLGAHPAFHGYPCTEGIAERTEGKREHSGEDLCSSEKDKDRAGDQSRVTVPADQDCRHQAMAC